MARRCSLLETTDEVIDALGGNGPTGLIVGATGKAVSNWRQSARGRFPPETFVALTEALSAKDLEANKTLWGMIVASTTSNAVLRRNSRSEICA